MDKNKRSMFVESALKSQQKQKDFSFRQTPLKRGNSVHSSVCPSGSLVIWHNASLTLWAHCCHMGTDIKHPVPDRVKPSFVIFDIRALWHSVLPDYICCVLRYWTFFSNWRTTNASLLLLLLLSSGLSVRVPGCQKLQMTVYNPVWHRMLYSCNHMATVKGLSTSYRLSIAKASNVGGVECLPSSVRWSSRNCWHRFPV